MKLTKEIKDKLTNFDWKYLEEIHDILSKIQKI